MLHSQHFVEKTYFPLLNFQNHHPLVLNGQSVTTPQESHMGYHCYHHSILNIMVDDPPKGFHIKNRHPTW